MNIFHLDFLAFFLSSLVALSLVYYQVSTSVLQQAIALLLLILLVIAKRFIFSKSPIYHWSFRVLLLFLSALFVQLLVISSGGFYSPFLILFYLYTLGTSFLLQIGSATSFLIFSTLVLLGSTFLNQTMLTLFRQDPGSVILYFISFVVIIPLAQFLMRTYHLKDTISKLLTEHIKLGEKREELILGGLNELVLVTDKNLKILSVNAALEKALDVEGEIVGKNLFDVLHVKSEDGTVADVSSLSIDKAIQNQATHIIRGFELETKSAKSFKVVIQIKPVISSGVVSQIVFLIIDARVFGGVLHASLDEAMARQKVMEEELKKGLANSPSLKPAIALYTKFEEDLLLAQELEDHPIREAKSFQDVAWICQQVVFLKQELAGCLNVNLRFTLPEGNFQEQAFLRLAQSGLLPKLLPVTEFTVPINTEYASLLIQKLVDLGILIASEERRKVVDLSLNLEGDNSIRVTVNVISSKLGDTSPDKLFEKYFLKLGSGLEGFIAKQIADQLNLPIKIEVSKDSLIFQLKLNKKPPTYLV